MSDMNGLLAGLTVGEVKVVTTSNGGHPPEHYAERICDRLIFIGKNAPPEIQAQAIAYREAMQGVILAGIRGAILSNHTTLIAQLRKAGMENAAQFIFSLRS